MTDVVAETRNGKRVPWPVALGNSIAKWRVFTRDDVKARRVYRFRADQQHGVTEVTLASNSGRARHAERAPPEPNTARCFSWGMPIPVSRTSKCNTDWGERGA